MHQCGGVYHRLTLAFCQKTPQNVPMTEETRESRLAAAAKRALAEAEERRKNAPKDIRPVELGGRDGPEPTRYGDWEKKGIVSDF
jgi:hypothetical protein